MKAEGNPVPTFCFWAFNGPAITVVQDLYEKIYKADKYKDLWFTWDGKPLLLYNGTPGVDANGRVPQHPNPHFDPAAKTDTSHPHYGDPAYTEQFYTDYTPEVKAFFTLRTMWWGYYKWAGRRFIGSEDNWSFGYDLGDERVKAMNPDDLISKHQGIREEAAVTPAQHPSSLIGKSWTPGTRRTRAERIRSAGADPRTVAGQDGRTSRRLWHLLPAAMGRSVAGQSAVPVHQRLE